MKNKNKAKFNLKILIQEPYYAHEKFHEKTKIKKWQPSSELDVKDWPKSWKTTFFKEYPRLDKVILPLPSALNSILLQDALMKRKSSRRFSKKPLTLEQLGNLLYWSAGLRDNKPPWIANRFYPSPGARYTIEVYIISKNTELTTGVYHYNLRSHCLETLILLKKFREDKYLLNQEWLPDAPCFVCFTTIFDRNIIKYGERGYRHVLQESGHIGQNFYLVAATINIAICGIGGYFDDKLNKLIDVDGVKETVVYVLAVGNPKG